MLCLGIDPGTKNFAYCLLDNGICVKAGMFKKTITALGEKDCKKLKLYLNNIDLLIYRLSPDSILIERFAIRRFKTGLVELVGIMIGAVLMRAHISNMKNKVILASTWKKNFEKFTGINVKVMQDNAIKFRCPPHIVDALLLATYLHSNFTFEKFSKSKYNKNLKIAVGMLEEEDKLKVKRQKSK